MVTGVYGRITELGKVGQKKHQLALAVAMGKDIDAVVVDTDQTALQCIERLK